MFFIVFTYGCQGELDSDRPIRQNRTDRVDIFNHLFWLNLFNSSNWQANLSLTYFYFWFFF